jgi:hypothetical protein
MMKVSATSIIPRPLLTSTAAKEKERRAVMFKRSGH